MAGIVHYRHGVAIEKVERVLRDATGTNQYILVVYDGVGIPKAHRCCSYVSNAPLEDVHKILAKIIEQHDGH
jgi:serine/threonine protein phosphatase PrpC